jgi:drug/metabolite transporter (DMT)-like permease
MSQDQQAYTGSRVPQGLRYMVLSAFFFSLMTLFVKIVGQRLPTAEIVLVRGFVTLVFSYALLRGRGIRHFGHNKTGLLMRGAAGSAALMCLYYAVTKLPLAEATVIQYTNPVLTALLATVYLHESMSRMEIASTLLSLAGVLVIARPGFLVGASAEGLALLPVAIALLGAILSSIAYVTVRKLSQTEHPLVIVFYFPLVSTFGVLPLAAPTAIWPTWPEWIMLVAGVGLTAQAGQVFLTKGLQLEPAGRAMTMSYLQIPFAALWGLLFLSEYPDVFTFAGAALVLIGAIVLSRSKSKVKRLK